MSIVENKVRGDLRPGHEPDALGFYTSLYTVRPLRFSCVADWNTYLTDDILPPRRGISQVAMTEHSPSEKCKCNGLREEDS